MIYRWQGAPLLRNAACPTCRVQLSRTAARLARRVPVLEQAVLELEAIGQASCPKCGKRVETRGGRLGRHTRLIRVLGMDVSNFCPGDGR